MPDREPRPTSSARIGAPRPALVLVVRVVILAALVVPAVVGARTRAELHHRSLPPCVEEDGSGGPVPCVWDAPRRGDHRGTPTIVKEAP